MQRAHIGLSASIPWSMSLGGCLWALSSLPFVPALAVSIGLAALAGAVSWGIGALDDRRATERLRLLAGAAGAARTDDAWSDHDALVARLVAGLGQASATAQAFEEMRLPALICDSTGSILVSSRGLREMAPRAVSGASIDAVYGEGFLAAGGGAAEESLVSLDGRRFEAHIRGLGAGRDLITLTPAGSFVSDDDLDAFATAITDGRSSFRFGDAEARGSAVLMTLNAALEVIDQTRIAMGGILSGYPRTEAQAALRGDLGIRLRALDGEVKHLRATLQAETTRRKAAETGLAEFGEALEACRSSIAALRAVIGEAGAPASDGQRRAAIRSRGRRVSAPGRESEEAPRLRSEIDAVEGMVAALDARLGETGVSAPASVGAPQPPTPAASTETAEPGAEHEAGEGGPRRGALAVAARRLRNSGRRTEPATHAGARVH